MKRSEKLTGKFKLAPTGDKPGRGYNFIGLLKDTALKEIGVITSRCPGKESWSELAKAEPRNEL